MTQIQLRLCFATVLAFALVACGDDSGGGKTDAGRDASAGGSGGSGGSGGTGGGSDAGDDAATGGSDAGMDAGGGDDAGKDAGTPMGAKETFKLKAGNLSFDYVTDSGRTLTFKFPASAAGKTITVESVSPKSVTWGNPDFKTAFSEVIKLGPSGTKFSPPVKVTPSDKSLFALNFSDTEGVPEPLVPAGDGKSLLLTHFSTLAIVGPTDLCDSVGGWTDTADVQGCTGETNVFRNFGAKCYRFCYTINAGCCVDPSVTSDANDGCELDSVNVYASYLRSDTNGGDYPYCADGLPTASNVTGSLVAGDGDQTITLTGTNFSPLGSVVINLDTVIATTWNSATSATATVPGSALTSAGTLTGIAYVNPTWNASGACTSSSLANCDFTNRSSPALTEPIAAAPSACPVPEVGGSPIGTCTITSSSECVCAMDYDSGGGIHTYEIACASGQCECKRDSVIKNDGATGGACTDKASLQAMWTSLCAPASGFCP